MRDRPSLVFVLGNRTEHKRCTIREEGAQLSLTTELLQIVPMKTLKQGQLLCFQLSHLICC